MLHVSYCNVLCDQYIPGLHFFPCILCALVALKLYNETILNDNENLSVSHVSYCLK
jgi:hypothetical protein